MASNAFSAFAPFVPLAVKLIDKLILNADEDANGQGKQVVQCNCRCNRVERTRKDVDLCSTCGGGQSTWNDSSKYLTVSTTKIRSKSSGDSDMIDKTSRKSRHLSDSSQSSRMDMDTTMIVAGHLMVSKTSETGGPRMSSTRVGAGNKSARKSCKSSVSCSDYKR